MVRLCREEGEDEDKENEKGAEASLNKTRLWGTLICSKITNKHYHCEEEKLSPALILTPDHTESLCNERHRDDFYTA